MAPAEEGAAAHAPDPGPDRRHGARHPRRRGTRRPEHAAARAGAEDRTRLAVRARGEPGRAARPRLRHRADRGGGPGTGTRPLGGAGQGDVPVAAEDVPGPPGPGTDRDRPGAAGTQRDGGDGAHHEPAALRGPARRTRRLRGRPAVDLRHGGGPGAVVPQPRNGTGPGAGRRVRRPAPRLPEVTAGHQFPEPGPPGRPDHLARLRPPVRARPRDHHRRPAGRGRRGRGRPGQDGRIAPAES